MKPIYQRQRIGTDIPVTLTSVLASVKARIVNLSADGARIAGASLPPGTQCTVTALGQVTYATCVWSEVDRMGVRFQFGLDDGPLLDALLLALEGAAATALSPAFHPSRPDMAVFGRRNG